MGGKTEAGSKATPREAEKDDLQIEIEELSFFRLLKERMWDEDAEGRGFLDSPIEDFLLVPNTAEEVRQAVEKSRVYTTAKRDARQLRRWNISFEVIDTGEKREDGCSNILVRFTISK